MVRTINSGNRYYEPADELREARPGDLEIMCKQVTGTRIVNPKPPYKVNVKKTNERRIEAIIKSKLTPVKKESGMPQYREIFEDRDGLVIVRYSKTVPEYIYPLTDTEAIPIRVAARYAGMSEEEITELKEAEELGGRIGFVNLKELNRVLRKKKPKSL